MKKVGIICNAPIEIKLFIMINMVYVDLVHLTTRFSGDVPIYAPYGTVSLLKITCIHHGFLYGVIVIILQDSIPDLAVIGTPFIPSFTIIVTFSLGLVVLRKGFSLPSSSSTSFLLAQLDHHWTLPLSYPYLPDMWIYCSILHMRIERNLILSNITLLLPSLL